MHERGDGEIGDAGRVREQFGAEFFDGSRLLHGGIYEQAERRKIDQLVIKVSLKAPALLYLTVVKQRFDQNVALFVGLRGVEFREIDGGKNFGIPFVARRRVRPPGIVAFDGYERLRRNARELRAELRRIVLILEARGRANDLALRARVCGRALAEFEQVSGDHCLIDGGFDVSLKTRGVLGKTIEALEDRPKNGALRTGT